MFWPDTVSGPLMVGSEEGKGLHNIAAAMQIQSPEFVDMTEAQKKDFLELLAVEK